MKLAFASGQRFSSLWLNNVSYSNTSQVSEEVNRKCSPGNTPIQLSTPYTPTLNATTRIITDRQKDRRMDESIVPIADQRKKHQRTKSISSENIV